VAMYVLKTVSVYTVRIAKLPIIVEHDTTKIILQINIVTLHAICKTEPNIPSAELLNTHIYGLSTQSRDGWHL